MPSNTFPQHTSQAQPRKSWIKQLKALTSIPTATGHEHAIETFVDRWLAKHPKLICKQDAFGNRVVQPRGSRGRKPVFFTAHMDHPAFVVRAADQPKGQAATHITARFYGGVKAEYFVGTSVQLWRPKPSGGGFRRGPAGIVISHTPPNTNASGGDSSGGWWPVCEVAFEKPIRVTDGMILTWALPKPEVIDGVFHAPVCDDLAGLAAALCAVDWALKLDPACDVRLLLTRAEEVGLLGAVYAAENGTVPKGAKLVCLETSKALSHAPIGGGPIVRVGDRSGVFDRELTGAVGAIAQQLADADPSFVYQRKLMDGGSCEATAFCALGYTATCCCLPLGNYHNMDEATGTIARESIAVSDFEGLVRLLTAIALQRGTPTDTRGKTVKPLNERLGKLLQDRMPDALPT